MYCIYSLPSTSRSSDLGNAATEEEQVGLLYFCDFFFWLLLQFCADPREGSKGHRFRTFAIRELLSCHIDCDPPTHGQLGSTLDGPWSTRKGGMSIMTFFLLEDLKYRNHRAWPKECEVPIIPYFVFLGC